MNKNEKFVITINRELGSGGRTIGRKLAERLGVTFYDKALIQGLQKEYHLSVNEIENLKGRNHSWWADFKRSLSLGFSASQSQYHDLAIGKKPDTLTTDEMFETEQEILRGIAEEESCVIAGRSGFYVFKDHPNRFNVLIQAPMYYRVERVMRKQNLTREQAVETIEKVDKMRENYVNKYTKTSRYDTRNYDLVISSANHTEDQIVDIIMAFIK